MKLPGILTLFSSYSFFNFSHRRSRALIKPTKNPLPSQWHTKGVMGVRHITDSCKLIFTLDLSKKHQSLFLFTISLKFSQSSLTPFRLFFHMFLLPHFLLAQKLLEGFWRDSSDCSIRVLPISWSLNNFINFFSGTHVSSFLS
jgi:hypothetical protein